MNHSNYIGLFLSMLAVNVPTLIVCLVAGVVILTRWQQAAGAALWALLGFGLILVLCFVIPAAQAAIQPWVFQSGNAAQRVWVFSVLTVFGRCSMLSVTFSSWSPCLPVAPNRVRRRPRPAACREAE